MYSLDGRRVGLARSSRSSPEAHLEAEGHVVVAVVSRVQYSNGRYILTHLCGRTLSIDDSALLCAHST